jgi:hypothetical protein
MPVVPSYDNLQTGLRPAAPNITGPGAGAIAGQQLQELGRNVSQAADAASRYMVDAQREANEVRVADALNRVVQARTDAQLGVLKLKGRDALERPGGKPLQDEAAEALGQHIATIREELGNDEQRRVFQQRSDQLLTQFRGAVGEHVLREYQTHRDDVDAATILTARRQAAVNPADEALRAQSLDTIRATVDATSARKGWAPEQRGQAMVEAMTPVHVGVIAYLSTRDVDQAQAYFNKHQSELDTKAQENVRQALLQRGAEVRAGGAVRELTASTDWKFADADRAITERFAGRPEELKMARAELHYQEQVRREARTEEQTRLLAPVQTLLGDSLAAGRAISKGQQEQAIGALRVTRPDLYMQGAKLIDQHNDELRAEGRAAAAHARDMANSSPDKALNGLALRYDMLLNPSKYRGANLMEVLGPEVRAGRLKPQDVDEAITLQQKWMNPKKQDEFSSLMTGTQYLDARLDGAMVDGKKFSSLTRQQQQEIKARALMAAEPLLQQLQGATGKKADKDEVKQVIDSLFVDQRYRKTFLGMSHGEAFTETSLTPDGATQRLGARLVSDEVAKIPSQWRTQIEKSLRQAGVQPDPATVLRYWQAGQGAR